MEILFIGDVFGNVGREMLKNYLKPIKKKYNIDFVIANGENITHGKGITFNHYEELLDLGVDCVTLGNHTFDKKDILNWIDDATSLIRPANYSRYTPGTGTRVFKKNGKTIRVSNIIGRVFFDMVTNLPIEALEDIIEKEEKTDIHIVDFHAEATAEKICFGYEFDGKVNAVLGTHTHVQTADERILDNNTAYITDVGMTGPFNHSIGMDKEGIMYRMKTGLPASITTGDFPGILSGVIVSIDDTTNKTCEIKRISLSPLNNYQL